jgi:hypothetical protein
MTILALENQVGDLEAKEKNTELCRRKGHRIKTGKKG